ncbi:MAG: imidazole glycerol phosphate synthase subunit HisH [Gammaproteobacteria bacterium]|nr:imidazole glycerol phosphate synthase subunit HisH [Gammaproteobacteria bacterium]
MSSIVIIDYGMGNIHSISKAMEHVADASVLVSADPEQILRADRVVFPGVGAIKDCMSELHRLELAAVLHEIAGTRPLLGICLGMQALLDHSDENDGVDGLGIFAGQVKHFPVAKDASGALLKVPHMGWNQVYQTGQHPMWKGIEQDSRFYFVHSYYIDPTDANEAAGITTYGLEFASVLARDMLFAVQFHPEKSQHAGLQLLSNFATWDGQGG